MQLSLIRSTILILGLLSTLAQADTAAKSAMSTLTFVKQNSKPKYFEANDEGLCGEIYALLKVKLATSGLSVVIDPVTYPIKRILIMLDQNEANVFCGAGRNTKREARYLYSNIPVYSVANVVSAKRDSTIKLRNISDIAKQNLLVGALFGTSSATFLKSHDGVRVNDKFHTVEEGLITLAENKHLNLFYYHDLGLNYLTKTMGLPIKVLPVRFRETPQWLIYSKETPPKYIKSIEKALLEAQKSGVLKTIQQKYLATL